MANINQTNQIELQQIVKKIAFFKVAIFPTYRRFRTSEKLAIFTLYNRC